MNRIIWTLTILPCSFYIAYTKDYVYDFKAKLYITEHEETLNESLGILLVHDDWLEVHDMLSIDYHNITPKEKSRLAEIIDELGVYRIYRSRWGVNYGFNGYQSAAGFKYYDHPPMPTVGMVHIKGRWYRFDQ